VDIEAAGTAVLMGNNGSGKTTLLNMAAGITRPDSGAIVVSGDALFDSGRGIDVPWRTATSGTCSRATPFSPHDGVR